MMKTTHQIIRERLKVPAQDDPLIGERWSLEEMLKFKWSEEFISLMKNRLIMGAMRYGIETINQGRDNVEYAKKKLRSYEQTGNLENLVDVANMVLLEFKHSRHPLKHFASLGDGSMHQEK